MSNVYLRRYLAETHSPYERARARMLAAQHVRLARATAAWQEHFAMLMHVGPWVVELKGRADQLEEQVAELRGVVGEAKKEVREVRKQGEGFWSPGKGP